MALKRKLFVRYNGRNYEVSHQVGDEYVLNLHEDEIQGHISRMPVKIAQCKVIKSKPLGSMPAKPQYLKKKWAKRDIGKKIVVGYVDTKSPAVGVVIQVDGSLPRDVKYLDLKTRETDRLDSNDQVSFVSKARLF